MISISMLINSCEQLVNPGDVTIVITPSNEDFIWENEIIISVTATKVDKLDNIVIYIDNVEVIDDHIEPYEYTWQTTGISYGEHKIKAIGHYEGKTSRDEIVVYFSPCAIFAEDLQNFTGITETDALGELTGNIDPDDWHFEVAKDYALSFGPAYPNPLDEACFIPFSLTEAEEITMIIINQDHEIIDVLLNNHQYDPGTYFKSWSAPANVNDIFRCIFHAADSLHWYGDLLVE